LYRIAYISITPPSAITVHCVEVITRRPPVIGYLQNAL
jgi:hypothetical protein